MSSPDNGSTDDQRQLGLWDAISIIVGIVIGTTIYKMPWLIFRNVSDPWTGLGVWLFGGFLAIVGSLCYAELATTYPRAGGDYVYLTRAYHPSLGFLFAWAQLVVVFTSNIGMMAFVFAENATSLYDLRQLGDLGVSSEFLYALGAVLVIAFLNILGATSGKWTQNLLTSAKVVGLGAIIIGGLFWTESNPMEWRLAESDNVGWAGLAMIFVLFAYGGWNDAAFVAAEVRNGKRNIPLSLVLGVGLITLIYLLVNAAYLVGLGFDACRAPGAQLPQQLLEWLMPGFGGKAITIIIMISALGAVNGLTFTGARVYATLGKDYSLFGWFGHWRPGRGAPALALMLQALFTAAMIGALCTKEGHDLVNQSLNAVGLEHKSEWQPEAAFDTLLAHSSPIFWLFFLLTGMALFILRTKDAGKERPFRVPFYPVLPIIFCNTCLYMLYQSTIYVGFRVLFAVALVLLALPLYLLAQLFGGYRGDAAGPESFEDRP